MPNPVKGATNTVVSFNGSDITAYCDKADLGGTLDAIDVTNLASTGVETISPITTWKIGLSGFWDATIDGILGPEAVTPGTKRDASIELTDSASSSVSYAWTANAEVGNWQITAEAKGVSKFTAELRLSGAPTRS